MPALLARRALERVRPGQTVEVVADDPMAPIDIPHMCRQEGFECLSVTQKEKAAHLVLRRPENSA